MRTDNTIGQRADLMGFPYVMVLEEATTPLWCQELIQRFESNQEDQSLTVYKDQRQFTEVNISRSMPDIHEQLVRMIDQARKVYMVEQRITTGIQCPEQFGYEEFRMKRYLPNGKDKFGLHTDVGSYGSARRFVSFQWYLNTVTEGGETIFGFDEKAPDVTIPAVQGRLLIFPPLWTHPHAGLKPISGPKYIVTGYLHYL